MEIIPCQPMIDDEWDGFIAKYINSKCCESCKGSPGSEYMKTHVYAVMETTRD